MGVKTEKVSGGSMFSTCYCAGIVVHFPISCFCRTRRSVCTSLPRTEDTGLKTEDLVLKTGKSWANLNESVALRFD